MVFWTTVLAAALGAGLTKVVTEILGFHFNISSQVEKDRDDDLRSIQDLIHAVKREAATYWCDEDQSAEHRVRSGRISSDLLHIGQMVAGLFERNQESLDAVNLDLNRFDEAITIGDFGVRNRSAEPERIFDIERCANLLANKVKTCRRKLKKSYIRLKR